MNLTKLGFNAGKRDGLKHTHTVISHYIMSICIFVWLCLYLNGTLKCDLFEKKVVP